MIARGLWDGQWYRLLPERSANTFWEEIEKRKENLGMWFYLPLKSSKCYKVYYRWHDWCSWNTQNIGRFGDAFVFDIFFDIQILKVGFRCCSAFFVDMWHIWQHENIPRIETIYGFVEDPLWYFTYSMILKWWFSGGLVDDFLWHMALKYSKHWNCVETMLRTKTILKLGLSWVGGWFSLTYGTFDDVKIFKVLKLCWNNVKQKNVSKLGLGCVGGGHVLKQC